jgi:hypothetical protein
LYLTPAGRYSQYGQLFLMPVEVVVKSLFTLQPGGALNTPPGLLSSSSTSGQQQQQQQQQQQARDTGAAAAAGAGQGQIVFSSSCLAAYMAFALAMVSLTQWHSLGRITLHTTSSFCQPLCPGLATVAVQQPQCGCCNMASGFLD